MPRQILLARAHRFIVADWFYASNDDLLDSSRREPVARLLKRHFR